MNVLWVKRGANLGRHGDATPFTNMSVDEIGDILEKQGGFQRYGNELMYNGRTGQQLKQQYLLTNVLPAFKTYG